MTDQEIEKTLSPTSYKFSWYRMKIILVLLGSIVGIFASQFYLATFKPPTYQRNDTALVSDWMPYYLGIKITRTRTTWCNINPSRFIFTNTNVDGEPLPVILPIYTQNFVWPKLGKQTFVILVPIAPMLPKGTWKVQSVYTNSCFWYSFLTGPSLTSTAPLDFEIK